MPQMSRVHAALVLVAVLTAIAACSGPPSDDAAVDTSKPGADCFWYGPTFDIANEKENFAFPDSGAHYWAAQYTLPAGATLTLRGEFAHGRYQSLNTYNTRTNSPTDALNDVSTRADSGSTNPFLPGADRTAKDRSYTVTVLDELKPAAEVPNTLYTKVPGQERTTLLYRLYLPDDGTDETGNVGLPDPAVTLSDGRVVTGADVCTIVKSGTSSPAVETVDTSTYAKLRDQPGRPATFPAQEDASWRTFYNVSAMLGCIYQNVCGPAQRTGGQYSNIDNQYVTTYINRGFGEVLTLTGTMPKTPATLSGAATMPTDVDMRYWSLCNNEAIVTTKAIGCVFDEEIPLTDDRTYTIVASLPEERPANARAECGVAWLPLSPRGDGGGHHNDGYLLLRNMLPSNGFHHAAQNTQVTGDEEAVMGAYLPTSHYGDKAEFEARGCGNQS
ncbi:hypothetical protein [Gordonia malaquae]|uniref:hypothetical protein n=1 Tax=Gordonia malaquae TaxID=410332 RepID=UPI0030FF31E7